MVPLPEKKDLGFKFFDNPYEKYLSYWAKETRGKQTMSRKIVITDPKGKVIATHTWYYYLGFIVQEYNERTGETRIIQPSFARGSKRKRLEAQFHFKHMGRVLASRVCAFVWGNPWIEDFNVFQEWEVKHANEKSFQAHHLRNPWGGPPRRDHAMPRELEVMRTADHKEFHRKNNYH